MRDALMNVPVAAEIGGRRRAELRIHATAFKRYDISSDDCATWIKAAGLKQAVTTICIKVGYVLQNAAAS
jgi:hypothetical protein